MFALDCHGVISDGVLV